LGHNLSGLPTGNMDNRKISDLTINELQNLIKETVQKSVAEVMIEFAMMADMESQIVFEAEMNERVRSEMQSHANLPILDISRSHKLDD
jgi:hypothetical protein